MHFLHLRLSVLPVGLIKVQQLQLSDCSHIMFVFCFFLCLEPSRLTAQQQLSKL